MGADRVEIYTGAYGGALTPADAARELNRVVVAGRAAAAAGTGLNAGHDLNPRQSSRPGQGAAQPARGVDRPCPGRRCAEPRPG